LPFRWVFLGSQTIFILFISAFLFPVAFFFPWWYTLDPMIGRSFNMLGTAKAFMDSEDLARMTKFTMVEALPVFSADPENAEIETGMAFNMMLTQGRLLSEEEALAAFVDYTPSDPKQEAPLNYERLVYWYGFWTQALERHPGLLGVFKKYKLMIMDSKKYVSEHDYELSDLYLMLDPGPAAGGFFKDYIIFLLDGSEWWDESTHPGQAFLIKGRVNEERWRNGYLAKGQYSAARFDPASPWYNPQPLYATDEFGTWFTVSITSVVENNNLVISVDLPAEGVQQAIYQTRILAYGLLAVLFLIAYLMSLRRSREITSPITALVDGAEEVMKGNYDHRIPPVGRGEFINLVDTFNQITIWVKEKVHLKDAVSKLLSEELAEIAAREGMTLGGEEVNCTVMFTDFASFSSIAKHLTPKQIVSTLNDYFELNVALIKKHGGFTDKFIGDGIMAMFGAPIKIPDHAARAARCALEMQKAMREFNKNRIAENKVVFEMRIGLNSGSAIVGSIGSDIKMEYTSIGEVTNLAQRMESICKIGHVMMTENTFKQIGQLKLEDAWLDQTPNYETVKGYTGKVATFGIYTSEWVITVNKEATSPAGFYIRERIHRGQPKDA